MRAGLLVLVAIALSGCTQAGTAHFPAHHIEMAVPETASYPGLRVHGVLDGAGSTLTVDADVANDGNRTYRIETGCTSPWSEDLRTDRNGGQSQTLREPTAQCMSYALRDLAPGQSVSRRFTWDGTIWSDADRHYQPASPGPYTWSIRFVAYSPDGAALKRFDLDFPVTVA